MDEGPSSRPVPLSTPEITAPASHDVLAGNTLTISGRADPTVTVQVWDWLAPVATTTADDVGQWSVTLHEVEAGDHMYFAEAMREPKVRSERSNVVSVRVAQPVRPSPKSSHRTAPRLKLHPAGFVRKLAGRHAGTVGVQERQEPRGDAPKSTCPIPMARAPEIAEEPASVGANTPAPGDAPPTEAVPARVDPSRSVAEPPIRIAAIPLRRDQVVIHTETRALLWPITPADLGVADSVVVAGPPRYVRTERADHPVAPQRVWTERMVDVPSTTIPTVG